MSFEDDVIDEIAAHYERFKMWPTHIACGPEFIKSYPFGACPFPDPGGTFYGCKVILSPAHGNSFSVGRM